LLDLGTLIFGQELERFETLNQSLEQRSLLDYSSGFAHGSHSQGVYGHTLVAEAMEALSNPSETDWFWSRVVEKGEHGHAYGS
jgi:hypothetical protein